MPDANSGTVRRERPDRSVAEEIVFFPSVPGMPAPAPVPVEAEVVGATRVADAVSPSGWRLVVPGHGAVPVPAALFIGRNPSATAARPDGELLAVDDETRSLSKTHAMLELEGDALWVHDLGSTNGVWVVPRGEDARKVVPGQRAAVPSGCELELGDLIIRVERG